MSVTITYLQEATVTYSDCHDVREAIERWLDGEREDSVPEDSVISQVTVWNDKEGEYYVTHEWGADPEVFRETGEGSTQVYPDPEAKLIAIRNRLHKHGIETQKGTNFDLRISNKDATTILRGRRIGFDIIPANMPLMCKEYGEDEDWCELVADELDEDYRVDKDYQTIEIWVV